MNQYLISLVTCLGQAKGKDDKAQHVACILTVYKTDEIMELIKANDTWQGDIGAGSRIMAKVLYQLGD